MTPNVPAALLILAATASAPMGPPALTELAVTRQGSDYFAACRLVDGLSLGMLEEIEAGIETTLNYRLQLYRRRPGLPDQPLVRRVVECGVHHDALTRQYTLTRRLDGELVETHVTSRPEEMRAFLTTLHGIPVARAAELTAGAEYYLRARCDLGLVWRFYLIPWRLNTDWVRAAVPPEEEADVRGQRP